MISFFAALAILGQDPNQPTPPPPPTKVVATVNGHGITAGQVQAYLWDWVAPQVGQLLVGVELIRQEAAKQNVTVTAAEVNDRVNTQLLQLMGRNPQHLSRDQFIKQNHVPLSQIQLEMRAQILLTKLAEKNFKQDDFVHVATIIIRPKTQSTDDVQASVTRGNEAYAALQKGDSWEKVLPAYASDPQTVQNNGELGWIALNDFPAPTRIELQTLKLNGFTKPVQTPNGIQIFKLETRGKDATTTDLSQMKQTFVSGEERRITQKLQQDAKITTSY